MSDTSQDDMKSMNQSINQSDDESYATNLARIVINKYQLLASSPPVLRHPSKTILFNLTWPRYPRKLDVKQDIVLSRWRYQHLPKMITNHELHINHDAAGYSYAPTSQPEKETEWYVNFADVNLFGYYDGPLFAQDEIQVAEMPILACVREHLKAQSHPSMKPLTTIVRDKQTIPTPWLIMGADRVCEIDSGALYGDRFAAASSKLIQSSVSLFDNLVPINVLAMEAPKYGSGKYELETLMTILQTAYTAFYAASKESHQVNKHCETVHIHTGNWGCGAYGGNVVIMTTMQLLAARMAGIDQISYHAFSKDSHTLFMEGLELYRRLSGKYEKVDEFVGAVVSLKYRWGVPNGT